MTSSANPSGSNAGTTITLPLDAIIIEGRYRADPGDLTALTASIEKIGLLHPVVVTKDHRLVAGFRRIEAFRKLGRTEIPVRIVDNLADAASLLLAERDENSCRLDMTPSEKVAIGRALEKLERPKAMERMRAGSAPSEKFSEGRVRGDTRDIVGNAVGMSGPTYERAKAVIDAADSDDPDIRAVGLESKTLMDESGKVKPAFDRVRDAERRNINKSDSESDAAKPKDGISPSNETRCEITLLYSHSSNQPFVSVDRDDLKEGDEETWKSLIAEGCTALKQLLEKSIRSRQSNSRATEDNCGGPEVTVGSKGS